MTKINKLHFNGIDYDIGDKDIHDLTAKSTLVDNDEFMIADSEDSYWHKKVTMQDIIKATHKPKVSVLLVWWWWGGWWGKCCKGWWWWWGGAVKIKNEYWLQWTSVAVTVWLWWCGSTAQWCDWCPSCFWTIVANWWCGGNCNGWSGGDSGTWYSWWSANWTSTTSWWGGWWAGWPWNTGCDNVHWGSGWKWYLSDFEETDIRYAWWWWGGGCSSAWAWAWVDGWWDGGACNTKAATNWTDWTWWGGGWWMCLSSTAKTGGNWWSWVVIVKYTDNWMDGIYCATWWTVTCCNWYVIHCFTTDWTFCIIN